MKEIKLDQIEALDKNIYSRLLIFNRIMDSAQKQVDLQNVFINSEKIALLWNSLFLDLDYLQGMLIPKD